MDITNISPEYCLGYKDAVLKCYRAIDLELSRVAVSAFTDDVKTMRAEALEYLAEQVEIVTKVGRHNQPGPRDMGKEKMLSLALQISRCEHNMRTHPTEYRREKLKELYKKRDEFWKTPEGQASKKRSESIKRWHEERHHA